MSEVFLTKGSTGNLMGEGNTLCPLCSVAIEIELHLIKQCKTMTFFWFRLKDFNIARLESRLAIELITAMVIRS